MRTAAPILILAATTAAASAQVATWYWTVSDTGNGDGLIEPGESALLTLWLSFEPRQDQAGGGVAFIGPYDILGNDRWSLGSVEQHTNLLLIGDGQDAGVLDDSNNIRGIEHFQYAKFLGAPFRADNPIDLVFLHWTPHDHKPGAVILENGAPDAHIYTDIWGNTLLYAGAGGSVTFHVVPAPASAPAFGLCALAALRRRR